MELASQQRWATLGSTLANAKMDGQVALHLRDSHIVPSFLANNQCTVDVDACVSSLCASGSTCVSLPGGLEHRCICPDGKTGSNCDEPVDFCIAGLCLNNGRCEELPDGYKCHCPIGFTGANCETPTNPCEPNPCQNDGTCAPDPVNGYKCQCTDGYDGHDCTQRLVCL